MAQVLTTLFKCDESGWSETYYFGGGPGSAPDDRVQQFVTRRAAVLGSGATIIGTRYKATHTQRKPLRQKWSAEGKASDGDPAKPTFRNADNVFSCVVLPFATASGKRRSVTLSGFPDTWMVRDNGSGEFGLTHDGVTKLKEFQTYLAAAPWGLEIRERQVAGDFAPVVVTKVEKDVSGAYKITTKDPHHLVQGDKVVISKARGLNLAGLKGTRRCVSKVTDTSYLIDGGPVANLPDPYILGTAASAKVDYIYSGATPTGDSFIISSRKRGRPFSQRRGRRSSKR